MFIKFLLSLVFFLFITPCRSAEKEVRTKIESNITVDYSSVLLEKSIVYCIDQDTPSSTQKQNKTGGNSTGNNSGTTGNTGGGGNSGSSDPTGGNTTGNNSGIAGNDGTSGESKSTEGTGSPGNIVGKGSATDPSGETGTNSASNKSNFELQVEPDRKIIYSGEQTSIQIDLHEVDLEGNENLSCAGKEVYVRVTGLVDGTISHRSGKISLNEAGVAFIDYRAGQKDKQIKIIATYTPKSVITENPGTYPTDQEGTSGGNTETSPGSPTSDSPGTNPPDPDATSDNSTTDTSPDTPTGDNPGTNPPNPDGTSDNSTTDTSPGSPTGDNPGTNPPDPEATSDNSTSDTSPDTPTGDNPGTNPPDPDGTTDNSTPNTSPNSPTGDNPGTNPPDPDGTTDNSSTDTSPGSPTGDNSGTNPPDPDGTTDNSSTDTSPDSPSSDNPGTNSPNQDATSGNSSTEISPGAGTGQGPGTNPTNQSGTLSTGPNGGTPGYPEEVKGEATIYIKPLEYDATLTIKGSYKETERTSYKNQDSDGVEDGTFDHKENREASFYVPLKMENAGDMPILDQRWEYYRPLEINLSNFNASFRSRQYDHGEHGGFGFRTTIVKTKSPVNKKVAAKEFLLQSNIILIIDKKTNKVVKIATGGFPVDFKWSGSETMYTEGWTPDSRTADNETDPIDEEDQFDASPVEEPVPDPTFKGISGSLKKYFKDLGTPLPADIEIPEEDESEAEVEPDLLVKFGDGVTFFGGSGKKIIDNSEGSNISRKELTFNWSVTRKKKPL